MPSGGGQVFAYKGKAAKVNAMAAANFSNIGWRRVLAVDPPPRVVVSSEATCSVCRARFQTRL